MSKQNKSKEQIAAEIKQNEKVKNDKIIVKLLFPFMENMKTIYDAQTALEAVSGYIKEGLAKKSELIKVKDLEVNLTQETESEVTSLMKNILGQIENEKAEDMADLLERFSSVLPKIGANEFLKGPMSTLKITDIVAD